MVNTHIVCDNHIPERAVAYFLDVDPTLGCLCDYCNEPATSVRYTRKESVHVQDEAAQG